MFALPALLNGGVSHLVTGIVDVVSNGSVDTEQATPTLLQVAS
jgi:hypothetical protein